jgi:Ataxin-2 C-terminal region
MGSNGNIEISNSSTSLHSTASSNALNPQAPEFVPTFYKQDYDAKLPPKSYADVVNANKDPVEPVHEEIMHAVDDSASL